MKFDYAFLADRAELSPDGRFFIFGGGIEVFTIPSVPALASAALLLRFSVATEEVGTPHTFTLIRIRPNGEQETPCEGVAINVKQNPIDPSLPSGAAILLNLQGMPLQEAGKNLFHFVVDGAVVGELVFFVVVKSE